MVDAAEIVIVIVGGGPVGAALALALADSGFAPVVLESRDPDVPIRDTRPLALSYGSRLILERLGAWQALAPATPIESIHVSQHGAFGRIALTAATARLPALGYVVDYARLHAALTQALASRVLRTLAGARVTAIRPGHDAATVEFTLGAVEKAITAKLVVVADGGALQDLVPTRKFDYRQSALVTTVASELPHRNVAFERFTAGGPLALLPCGDDLALIWTASPGRARDLSELSASDFLTHLHGDFGDRLGAFMAVGARSVFPLTLKCANDVALSHAALIGNAAQTLHPVAGQGFNLGLRDAWELAGEIVNARPEAIGSAEMLAAYRARRRIDRGGGIWFTDSLVRLFSNDFAPLSAARGIALALLGCLPPARDFVVRRMTFGARGWYSAGAAFISDRHDCGLVLVAQALLERF